MAYRTAANSVETWVKAKDEERRAAAMREANERAASDLEFQIQALRGALVTHEKELDIEYAIAEQKMLEPSLEAQKRELEFITLAMRLCEPLRARPELSSTFEALESDLVAA